MGSFSFRKLIKWLVIVTISIYGLICLLVYSFQEKLLFIPEKLNSNYTFQFNDPFEESYIKSPTGNNINQLIFHADHPKGIILFFHGNAGSLRTWGTVADRFLKNNYDIVIMDYAGYGKSTGALSEKNLFADAQAAYDMVKKKYNEQHIVVYGRSIGTGIAAYIASTNNPQKLILESPFLSMSDLAHHIYPYLPVFILNYPLRTDVYIKKVHCPVYIFHGTDDEIVYYDSSVKLKNISEKNTQLITINNGHHNDLAMFSEYQTNLDAILK